jgi:hypothetical protein
MKISASLLVLGLILSLSALSARELPKAEKTGISIDQQLKLTSEILERKQEARTIRAYR